ncbi:gluconate:H+ symporter [Foetidibacter luteolus]|uniref:gluconate:H+ symporter n=1 Tax=Foetidibacter luteolus TaxID=2608880 RepID=UPI00129A8180|nr:gluconate:H+ symporter [Foetidibacter luteolus]
MTILITVTGILVLVFLISYVRLNTFLAFLIVSIGLGLLLGLQPIQLMKSIQDGIGSTLGSIAAIIALGAMLGKLVGISGAAEQISAKMTTWFGVKHIRWAFMVTGFIVSLPLFYSVGFMLLVPIAITVAVRNNLPAVYVGLPLLASLSVTQGYLPPHPAPLFLVKQLNADMGLTLLYGIIISVPAILISGGWYGSTVKKYNTQPNLSFVAPPAATHQLPTVSMSVLTLLLPILLIGGSALIVPFTANGAIKNCLLFVGDATVSLIITIVFALFSLGIFKRHNKQQVNEQLTIAVKEVASLLLIFGGAGALKQVLTDGGVSQLIAGQLQNANMNAYVLGWSIAAVIRVCVGSSTVSGITTAGFIAPLLATTSINPNLMVLSIGAGSMMFSHVNDTGFWLFREYFQLSLKDTIKTWSVMDTLVSVMGLIGVLVLSWWV